MCIAVRESGEFPEVIFLPEIVKEYFRESIAVKPEELNFLFSFEKGRKV